jgi:hypothetical protein
MAKTRVWAILMFVQLAGCTTAVPPSDIPLPPDARVVPPADTVPKDIAAFSGKWNGAWYGEKTSTYMADQVIVVERIIPPSAAEVTYAGIGRWGSLNGRPWVYRVDGTFGEGTLEFTVPGGINVVLRMNRNETLDAVATGRGGTWRGTFGRVAN